MVAEAMTTQTMLAETLREDATEHHCTQYGWDPGSRSTGLDVTEC